MYQELLKANLQQDYWILSLPCQQAVLITHTLCADITEAGMILNIWKTGEVEKWHQMMKGKHNKEWRAKKEKLNIQIKKKKTKKTIGTDQFCREVLGDNTDSKAVSQRKL